MARKYKTINELYGILFMVLLTFSTIKSENIDCYGKSFHCVNSTHFMICVGVGEGLSSTVDDFIIPCPTATECHRSNNFECEFPPSTTPTTIIHSSDVANDLEFENYGYSTKPPWENFDTTMVLTPKYNERPYGYEKDLNSRKNSYTDSYSETPTIKPKYAEFNKVEPVTITPTASPTTPDAEHLSSYKSLDTYVVAPTSPSVLASDLSDRKQFEISSAKSKYEPETNTEIPPDTHSTSMNVINETGREISQNKIGEAKNSIDDITVDYPSKLSSLESIIDTTVVNNSNNIMDMDNSKSSLANTPEVELFKSTPTIDISVVPTQPSEKYSQTPGDVKTTYPTNINAEELYNATENEPLNSPTTIEVTDYKEFSTSGLQQEPVNYTELGSENYNVKHNSMDGSNNKETDALDPALQIYPLENLTESVTKPPLKDSIPNLTNYDYTKNSFQITNTEVDPKLDNLNSSRADLTPSPSIILDKIEEFAQTIIDTLNNDSINKQIENGTGMIETPTRSDKPKLNINNSIGKSIETNYGSLGDSKITSQESKPSSLETVDNIQTTRDITVSDVTTVTENKQTLKPNLAINELTTPDGIELLITKSLNSSSNNTVLVPDKPLEYFDKTNNDMAVSSNFSNTNDTYAKPTIVLDGTPMWNNDMSNMTDGITETTANDPKYYNDVQLTTNYQDNTKPNDNSQKDKTTPFQHDIKSIFNETVLENMTKQNKDKEYLDYIPVLNNTSNNSVASINIDNTLITNNSHIDNIATKIYAELMNNTTLNEVTTINSLSPNFSLSSLDINDANLYDEIIGQYRSTRNLDFESTLAVPDNNNHKPVNEIKNIDQFIKSSNPQDSFQTTKEPVADVNSETKELKTEKADTSISLQDRTQDIPSTNTTSENIALANVNSLENHYNSSRSNDLKKNNDQILNDETINESSTKYPDTLDNIRILNLNKNIQSEVKSTTTSYTLSGKENNSDSLPLMKTQPKIFSEKKINPPLIYEDLTFYADNTSEDGIDKLIVILENSLKNDSHLSLNKNNTSNVAISDNLKNNNYDSKNNQYVTKISDNPNLFPTTTQQNTFTQSQIPTNLSHPFSDSSTPTSSRPEQFTQRSTSTSSLSKPFTQNANPTSIQKKEVSQIVTPTISQSKLFTESSTPSGVQSQTFSKSSSPTSSQLNPFTQILTPSSFQSHPVTPSSISTSSTPTVSQSNLFSQSLSPTISRSDLLTQSSTPTEPFIPSSSSTGYHSDVFSQHSSPTGSRSDLLIQSLSLTSNRSDTFIQSSTPTKPFTQSSTPTEPFTQSSTPTEPFTQSSTPTEPFTQSSTPTGSHSDLFSQSLNKPFTQISTPTEPFTQSSTLTGSHPDLFTESSTEPFIQSLTPIGSRSDPFTQSTTATEPLTHSSTLTGSHSNIFTQSSTEPFTQSSTPTGSRSDPSTQSLTPTRYRSDQFTQSSTPTGSRSDTFTQSSTVTEPFTQSSTLTGSHSDLLTQSSTDPYTQSSTSTGSHLNLFTQSSTPSETPTVTFTQSSIQTEPFIQSSTPHGSPTATFTQSSTPTSFQFDPYTRSLSNAQTVTQTDRKLTHTDLKNNTSIKEGISVSAGYRISENERKDLKINATHRPNVSLNVDFKCQRHVRGKFGDKTDCRKYYICIGYEQPLRGHCPNNTVYSEINRSCTKNLSHCMENYNFECPNEGRFLDYLTKNTYYICLRNTNKQTYNKYKFQCLPGYQLNKKLVKCLSAPRVDNGSSNDSQSSKSNSEKESIEKKVANDTLKINFAPYQCTEEGKFPDPNDKNCRVYYDCKSKKNGFRRKRRRCENDEYFDPDSEKCVDTDSYECEF